MSILVDKAENKKQVGILFVPVFLVNSVLMRRSVVANSEEEQNEIEDRTISKEDQKKDHLSEHEYWQDESTKL